MFYLLILILSHFCAIGYEYNKVRPNIGKLSFGDSVQFSIPAFGDFFNDMVCRIKLSEMKTKQSNIPERGSIHFPHGEQYKIVDFNKNEISSNYNNFVHYCEYPANRLFEHVSFDVNSNILNEYDYKLNIMDVSFNNLCGQQNYIYSTKKLNSDFTQNVKIKTSGSQTSKYIQNYGIN